MNMGRRVKMRLEQLGRSQRWLAEAAGVSDQVIHNIIRRDQKKSEFQARIAMALGVTDLWLQTGRHPMERATPGQQAASEAQGYGHAALKLAALFTQAPERRRREVWPCIVRALAAESPALLKTFLPYPEEERPRPKSERAGRKRRRRIVSTAAALAAAIITAAAAVDVEPRAFPHGVTVAKYERANNERRD